jgi:hypothetical protein
VHEVEPLSNEWSAGGRGEEAEGRWKLGLARVGVNIKPVGPLAPRRVHCMVKPHLALLSNCRRLNHPISLLAQRRIMCFIARRRIAYKLLGGLDSALTVANRQLP